MDVTPTTMGASVDVTDVAIPAVIEVFADAFADQEILVARLLLDLASARSALKALRSDVANGRDVSDERIERTACEVDGIRDTLADLLDPRERVTVPLTAVGCRKSGEALLQAAASAEGRFRTAGQTATVKALLPHQREAA